MATKTSKTTDTVLGIGTGNSARVRRYRALHRRIDYSPSPAALAMLEAHLAAGMDNCLAGVIDRLVMAGHRAITGNGKGAKP
jgi:hypothetical protein